jgi:tetratricopeptide (TPR) repeat protein
MIRRSALVLAFALSLPAAVFAADAAPATFEDANARYQKGDFKAAADGYGQLVAAGPRTASRFYNLGNAAFRSGKKGAALLNYRRALEIAPRDEDTRWNVLVVQSAVTDRVADPTTPLDVAVEKITAEVSANEAAAAFAGALALWALASFAAFAGVRGGVFGFLRMLIVTAVLVSGLALAVEWYAHRDPRAVVLVKEAVARYGPSTRETKAFVLHEGAEVRVTDQTKDWVCVTLQGGSSGWIPRDACETV